MNVTLGFMLGILAGAWIVRRTTRKQLPRLPRGMTRHVFHVDLPEDEMPELALRDYYQPRQKRTRI